MADPDLLGYLIGAIDAADEGAVEAHLRCSPEARARLEHLRAALTPLEVERECWPAPAGLADRALALVAAHIAAGGQADPADPLGVGRTVGTPLPTTGSESVSHPAALGLPAAPRAEPESQSIGGRFRPDHVVACAIALLVCGLVLTGVAKVRARSQLLACQSNLQTVYAALTGYADTHDGRYPQIAPDATAESFATALVEAGQAPADFRPGCPAIDPSVANASYTYTLGFQSPDGSLVGLRRPDGTSDEHDLLPISADFPTESAAPMDGPLCAHPPLMNVLYMGGNVRTTTSPLIGPNGDDIYRNLNGRVAAGIGRLDVVLGRPGDRP